MAREDILGPWKLVSMKATNPEGDIFYPFGETPTGMIMYDASGYMSYTAMRADRPKFASEDLAGGTNDEKIAAFEGFDAYCGTYKLNIEEGTVRHQVEASRFPNWEGSEQLRFFKLSGDRLLIKTPPMSYAKSEWVIEVAFQRP